MVCNIMAPTAAPINNVQLFLDILKLEFYHTHYDTRKCLALSVPTEHSVFQGMV